MYATIDGTTRYIDRFPQYRDAAFYRTVRGLNISEPRHRHLPGRRRRRDRPVLHRCPGRRRRRRHQPVRHRHQLPQPAVGTRGRRSPAPVATRRDRGLHQSRLPHPRRRPRFLKPEHVVGKMHSMDPDFLADQIDRSRANLGVDTIDVFYLHNPETQLGFLTRDEFDERLLAPSPAWSNWRPTRRSAGTAPPPGTASARAP